MAKVKAKNNIEAPLNTPSVKRFTDSTDRQVGDPIVAIKRVLQQRLQPDYLKSLAENVHNGKVMRIVKDVVLSDNGRWHEMTNGTSEAAPKHTIFYVYVPAIHGQILPTPKSYEDPIIELLPQFVGAPGIELPSLGAIVEVEFKDSDNYDQGVYHGLAKDKPIAPWTPPEEDKVSDSFGPQCIGRPRALFQADTKPKPNLQPMGDANPGSRAPILYPTSIANASAEVQAKGIKGKGIFIENVSQETLGAPLEAAEKAVQMGLSWVVVRAIEQNPWPEDTDPQKGFFNLNKQMHGKKNIDGYNVLLDRDTIKKYSDEFIKKGILVYLYGRPWNGMEGHNYSSPDTGTQLGFVDYMVETAKYVNAVGIIADASVGWAVDNPSYPVGYTTSLGVLNSSQAFIIKGKKAGLHIGLSAPPFSDLGLGLKMPWGSLDGYDFYIPRTRMPTPQLDPEVGLAYGAKYFMKSIAHYQSQYPNRQIIFCLGASGVGYGLELSSNPQEYSEGNPYPMTPIGEEEVEIYDSYGAAGAEPGVGKNHGSTKKPPERMRDESVWAGLASQAHESEAVIWWDWKNLNETGTYNEDSIYEGPWSNGPLGAKSRWDVVKSFGYFAELEVLLALNENIKIIPSTNKVSGRTYKNWSWTKDIAAAETTAGLDEV